MNTRWHSRIIVFPVNLIYFTCSSLGTFTLYIFFKAFRHCRVCCVMASHTVPSGGCLAMLLQIHCPDLTSALMTPPSVSPLLAMRATGFASAAHSTRAGCASSALASATPAVTERRACRSPSWRPCASAPTAGRVSCAKNVSVTDWCKYI